MKTTLRTLTIIAATATALFTASCGSSCGGKGLPTVATPAETK